jgi:HAMP domain-containing protein
MRLSLRAQIALILLGVTGLTVALVGIPVLNLMERALVEQQLMSGRRITELAARTIEADLDSGLALDHPEQREVVTRVAGRFFESGLFDRLELFGADGSRLSGFPIAEGGRAESLGPPRGTAEQDSDQARLVDLAGIGRVVVVERELAPGGQALGVLRAILSAGTSMEQLETARLLTALYALLDAVLVLIVGYLLLTRIVVTPIRRVGVATQRVAAGDYASRLDVRSRNEIGALAVSFNHMLDRLEAGRHALEEQVTALQAAKIQLERAQAAIIRGQRLASVGRLAAGVAQTTPEPPTRRSPNPTSATSSGRPRSWSRRSPGFVTFG